MEENKKYSVEELLEKLNASSAGSSESQDSSFTILQRKKNVSANTSNDVAKQSTGTSVIKNQSISRQQTAQESRRVFQQRYNQYPGTNRGLDNVDNQNRDENLNRPIKPKTSKEQESTKNIASTQVISTQQRIPIQPKKSDEPLEKKQDVSAPQAFDILKHGSGAEQRKNVEEIQDKKSNNTTNSTRQTLNMDDIDSVQEYFNNKAIRTEHIRLRHANIQKSEISKNLEASSLKNTSQTRLDEPKEDNFKASKGIENPTVQMGKVAVSTLEQAESVEPESFKKKRASSQDFLKKSKVSLSEIDGISSFEPVSEDDTEDMIISMRRSVFVRLILSVLCTVGIVYFSLAQIINIPMLNILIGKMDIISYIIFGIFALQVVINSSTIGGGFISLFTFRPDNDSYCSLACFAALLQGAYVVFNPQLLSVYSAALFVPVVALILIFNALGKLMFVNRLSKSFYMTIDNGTRSYMGVTTDASVVEKLYNNADGVYPYVAYLKRADGLESFVDEGFSDSSSESISKIIAPICAVVSVLCGFLSYFLGADAFSAISASAAIAVITAPLSAALVSQFPLYKVNGVLNKTGASISGYNAVAQLSKVNSVLLTSDQLFPKQNIGLMDIKALQGVPISRVITDIVGCVSPFKSNFTRMFLELTGGKSPQKPDDAKYHDSQGFTAWLSGKRVQVGTRAFMQSYNVSLPHINLEKDYNKNNHELLYVASAGVATGIIVISHTPNRAMQMALGNLCDNGFSLLVMSSDPTLTAERVGSLYKYPPELITIVSDDVKDAMNSRVLPRKLAGSTVSFENTTDALKSIFLAKSCRRFSNIGAIFMAISIFIGMLIAIIFIFTNQILTLSWLTVAAYHAVWLIIVFLIMSIWQVNRT